MRAGRGDLYVLDLDRALCRAAVHPVRLVAALVRSEGQVQHAVPLRIQHLLISDPHRRGQRSADIVRVCGLFYLAVVGGVKARLRCANTPPVLSTSWGPNPGYQPSPYASSEVPGGGGGL